MRCYEDSSEAHRDIIYSYLALSHVDPKINTNKGAFKTCLNRPNIVGTNHPTISNNVLYCFSMYSKE
jgi:hypothetical protein